MQARGMGEAGYANTGNWHSAISGVVNVALDVDGGWEALFWARYAFSLSRHRPHMPPEVAAGAVGEVFKNMVMSF